MKIYIVLLILTTIYVLVESKEIKYVEGLNFQLELYSNEYRYYNFCNSVYDYRKPFGYVKVHSEHEIRDVLLYAKSIGKTVSVRSGGHSIMSLSVLNDTINLDMSGMKSIKVNPNDKTVIAQSGVLLGELYEELLKFGLISTGGTCRGVGMGIALGGGTGYLGSQHGHLVDNIIEHTVVLANGNIVKANKHNEYSDLHWTLLGAGHGGFGVVVDYKIKVQDAQPLYYHNVITIPIDYFVDTAIVLSEYVDSLSDDDRTRIYTFLLLNSFVDEAMDNVKIHYIYTNGPTCHGDIHFNELLKLIQKVYPNVTPDKGNKNEKTYMELIAISPDEQRVPSKTFGNGRFFSLNNETANAAVSIIKEFRNLIKNIKNDNMSFISVQIHYNAGKQITGDPIKTSFIHRGNENKWLMNLFGRYLNSENDLYFNNLKNNITKKADIFSTRIYQNFPEDVHDWQTKYYGDNYPILQEIKLKYDPSNYFNYPQSIKLPITKTNK